MLGPLLNESHTKLHIGFKGNLSINKPDIKIPTDLDIEYIATCTQN